jgi:Spy/CpxP family protein refolding chaperone
MQLRRIALAALFLALPVAAQAQNAQGPRGQGQGRMMSPVAVLLEHKAELGLSAEQVTKIEKISSALQEKNAPIMEKMRQARESNADRSQMQPLMEQVRTNNEAARKEVMALLSPEQQKKAQELAAQRRPNGGERAKRQRTTHQH